MRDIMFTRSTMTRFMSFIEEVQPDAVINMAHGRMGDKMVDYLKARNILLFAPLTINSLVDEWENDPMGMSEALCHRAS